MFVPRASVSASWLVLAAVALQPAEAAERRIAIDIPAGPLSRGLEKLAAQSGISLGTPGALPNVAIRAVKGRLTAAEALARLLAGTGLRAVAIAPGAYRLVQALPSPVRGPPPSPPRPPPPHPPPAPPPEPVPQEIVVTGLRRPQGLFTAPASMSVVAMDELPVPATLAASAEIAARVNGLTLTNLGEGRNRQFIRGVADSAFNGYSQSTVALVVDGARITYDAPDPDLRLVDVTRVEVLKGPQGPLYGSGALGGVYYIATHRPDPSEASASGEAYGAALSSGGIGGGGSLVVNLPVVKDRLALRASGYGGIEPGWIDDNGGPANANLGRVSGGRAALRWLPRAGWTLDLATAAQFITVDDSQYVPQGQGRYRRAAQAREPHDNDIRMANAQLAGSLLGMRLDLSASLVRHEVGSTLDASAAASRFGESGPLVFRDDRRYRVLDQEARLSGSMGGINWIAGFSHLSAHSSIEGTLEPASASARKVVSLSRKAVETALFTQASLPLAPRLRADIGLRLFRSISEDRLEESEGISGGTRLAERKTGLSPSLSIAWSLRPDRFLFARIARAERAPGLGAQASGAPARFASDHLTSFELGGRARTGTALVEASLFHAAWRDMQSDYLLPDGLIATHNAGDAEIWGAELSASLGPWRGWRLESGAVAQRARLVHAADGMELPEDSRLPVVPAIAARLSLARALRLGEWSGSAATSLRFNGSQRLSFDPGLDRRSPAYAVVDASGQLANGPWSIAINLTNLLGSHADTFGFGNPFSIRTVRQSTPLRPRGITLALKHAF